jgi:hypothetical protein
MSARTRPRISASPALPELYRDLALFKNLQCSMRLLQEKGWYIKRLSHQWLLRSVIAGALS